jgi:DNA-binding CsgD family transcriptional regulator
MAAEGGGDVGDGALLALIGDVCGLLQIVELRWGMLDSLQRVLPSDHVSLNDLGPTPEKVVAIMQPDLPGLRERWAERAHENPLVRHMQRTGDGRASRFSDVIGEDELHALPLYREVYVPMGVEHQLAFTLPGGPDRVLAIALSRGGRDYSDTEVAFANRARPFLIQAYLNASAYERLRARHAGLAAAPDLDALACAGLTMREAEVVRLLALGRSNQHIANELSISDRTVGKHLEHSFRKLGVEDRSSAAACAWELAERPASERGAPRATSRRGNIAGAPGLA